MYSSRSRTWLRRSGSSASRRSTSGSVRCARRACSCRRQLERGADIQRQVAGPLTEAEQRLHRGQRARPGARLAAQRIGEGLQVAEGDHGQWLGDEGQEAVGVGTIRALGVSRAPVQPQRDQLGVGVGLTWRRDKWCRWVFDACQQCHGRAGGGRADRSWATQDKPTYHACQPTSISRANLVSTGNRAGQSRR